MIRINLLPVRAAKKKESARVQLTIAGIAGFAVIALVVITFISYSSKVNSLKREIASGNQELTALKSKIGELSKIKEQKKVLEDKLRVVEKLEVNRTGPVRLLTSLSKAIPDQAWIYSLKESGSNVSIEGLAAYDSVYADFMRNLDKMEYKNVELVVASRGKKIQQVKGSERLISYSINFSK